jgi:hypothetical protein
MVCDDVENEDRALIGDAIYLKPGRLSHIII